MTWPVSKMRWPTTVCHIVPGSRSIFERPAHSSPIKRTMKTPADGDHQARNLDRWGLLCGAVAEDILVYYRPAECGVSISRP